MPIINTAIHLKDLPSPPPGKTDWPWTEGTECLPERMPDGSEWPRISIVTPSYNYGRFIEETIRSVLLQGYPNLEYIIIDGGSTDNTVEIIKKYEKYLTYWVSEPDAGQTDAINKGYQHCTGNIFAWLNADDAYTKMSLHMVAENYLQGYQMVAGSCLNVFNDGRLDDIVNSVSINFERYLKFWVVGSHFPQPAVFMAKEIADKCFPLDKSLYMLMDYQFFLRAISAKPKAIYIPNILVRFNFHGNNKSLSNYKDGMSEFCKITIAESKKLPLFKRIIYLNTLRDYTVLHPMIYTQKYTPMQQIMTALINRPTLLFWPRFWKILFGEKYRRL